MKQPSYFLSKQAFSCCVDGRYVFLDLRSDSYLCLGHAHSAALQKVWSRQSPSRGGETCGLVPAKLEASTAAVIQALSKKGLVVDDVAAGKLADAPDVIPPSVSLIEQTDNSQPMVKIRDTWYFFVAAAIASANLRWQSIEETVRQVRTRKSANAAADALPDIELIQGLFDIFQSRRPFYPRAYLCLFDSLALVHFFARYNIFPLWIFGIKLEPFAAHCWVQVHDVVVNDVVDNVRGYTPIMCV